MTCLHNHAGRGRSERSRRSCAIVRGVWIDDDGVAHTVALPEPAGIMSGTFRIALDELLTNQPDEVAEVLEGTETEVLDEDLRELSDPVGEAQFVGTPPPPELLTEAPTSPADLARILTGTDLRWRLDAVLALGDYADAE